MRHVTMSLPIFLVFFVVFQAGSTDTLCTHAVVLDGQSKIVSWMKPQSHAYDKTLDLLWNYIMNKVPNGPSAPLPMYTLYCGFQTSGAGIVADTWMNDVGEKIPNWFESARLYYAYSGEIAVMNVVKSLIDYSLDHGTTPSAFSWPNFPQTCADAGEKEFRGFTAAKRFSMDDIHVDLAGDMGMTYYGMYLFYREDKYKTAAVQVADVLAKNVRTGNRAQSPWPYVVNAKTGIIASDYCTNWFGCLTLFDHLIDAGLGQVDAYQKARQIARDWILQYPMQNGLWVDGHSDNFITGTGNLSNMSASNACLYLLEHPDFDPDWRTHVPGLLKWTEDRFVFNCEEPGIQWGAYTVAEQNAFKWKMGYQTSRYAAQCALWYAVSGDTVFKERAYRALNWSTYMIDDTGLASDGPTEQVGHWWSDCYGEGPRMTYYAFSAVPEWCPPGENHIVYSRAILKDVIYEIDNVQYTTVEDEGTEFLRLAFKPAEITVNGVVIPPRADQSREGYTSRDLGNGDCAVNITRRRAGHVKVKGSPSTANGVDSEVIVRIDDSKRYQQIDGFGVNANTASCIDEELEPAMTLLLDSMNCTIWRVVVEMEKNWEDENDNDNPFTFNWDYYNRLYESPKFKRAWKLIDILNRRGITKGVMINFMGRVPAWMGREVVRPEYEDELVEMQVSFLQYARQVRHLQIGLLSPTNESDIRNEGPTMDATQYTRLLRKLVDRMEAAGLGDIRIVAPDVASLAAGIRDYIPRLMEEPGIMSKLAHFGLHSYGGYYAPVDSALKHSAYPESTFWLTEWNAWRDGLDNGRAGVYDYQFASECVSHLLELIQNGASAGIVWEGWDSLYEHPPGTWSLWGILGFDPKTKTYSPRKHFYAISQVSKYVPAGSWRIAVNEPGEGLCILAFHEPVTGRISITGINKNSSPIKIKGTLDHLPEISRLEMVLTDRSRDLYQDEDIPVNGKIFTATIPADCIFTLSGMVETDGRAGMLRPKPEPSDWIAGDIHVHRNCGGGALVPDHGLPGMMERNDLAVISVLADMGNAEVRDAGEDLPKVNGSDAPQSRPGRIVHWDAEWHWDATYSNFAHQALGGHLVILGLKEAHSIWDESAYRILEWAKKQDAICGFAHMQYLNGRNQDELDCCIPIEYPVEVALGNIDFVSEDVNGSEPAIQAYYKLLNCGFKPGLAAGTDFPCNNGEPLGTLLTYVKVKDDPMTYREWIQGIKEGRTVISRNGHDEFLEMKVNDGCSPGDELHLKGKGTVKVEVKWTAVKEISGTVEVVCNGKTWVGQAGSVKPGFPFVVQTTCEFKRSGWLCSRRVDDNGHQSHTAAVFVTVDHEPVRASVEDAKYFIGWIDHLLEKTSPGQAWNRYFTHDLAGVQNRYRRAREIYNRISAEAQKSSP